MLIERTPTSKPDLLSVTGFELPGGDIPLRVQTVPEEHVSSIEYYMMGSSFAEVSRDPMSQIAFGMGDSA